MNLRPQRTESPDINLTPLIDVVFLLLIFFMVSTTFKDDARIQLELPEAQGQQDAAEEAEILVVVIDAAGTFYVNDRQVVDRKPETLRKAIAGAAVDARSLPVVIKADARATHPSVMTVMDAASGLGLLRFSFAGSRPDAAQ